MQILITEVSEISWVISTIVSSLKISENRIHNILNETLMIDQHRQAAERDKKKKKKTTMPNWANSRYSEIGEGFPYL